MKTHKLSAFIPILLLLCSYGCQHPFTPLVNTLPLDFTFSGNQRIGDKINFTSNSNNNDLVWKFGDADSSIGSSAVHQYITRATRYVTLLDRSTDVSVTKEIRITSGAERIAGTRYWDGQISGTPVTNYQMELIVTGDDVVCDPHVTFMYHLVYNDYGASDHITFSYPNPYHDGATINYYFLNDSITYSASGTSTSVFLHTK